MWQESEIEDKSWVKLFEQLEKDKKRLLITEMTLGGKKKRFVKDELVFFLGNLRCILTMDGWKFEQMTPTISDSALSHPASFK
jgi:hypothetical protein